MTNFLAIRKKLALTQVQVTDECEKLGIVITPQYYSMIENGIKKPSVKTAKALATVLGIEWTSFFD